MRNGGIHLRAGRDGHDLHSKVPLLDKLEDMTWKGDRTST